MFRAAADSQPGVCEGLFRVTNAVTESYDLDFKQELYGRSDKAKPGPPTGTRPGTLRPRPCCLLEAAGVLDPETVMDDPLWVEWRGGCAHQCTVA